LLCGVWIPISRETHLSLFCRLYLYRVTVGKLRGKLVNNYRFYEKSAARIQRQLSLAISVALPLFALIALQVDASNQSAIAADRQVTAPAKAVESAKVTASGKVVESAKNTAPGKVVEPAKVALVLGGGGARGAAHIGVLRVLEENNMKPDLIVANSMGSIIGSLYCAGVPLDKIEELCIEGKVKKAFAPFPLPVQIMKKAVRPKIPFKRIKRYPGLYNGDSLETFINKTVGEEHTKLESLPTPLVITVVNLLDGKAYRMTKGDLGKIVRASCSLPPIVKPVEYEGMLLADGGIRTNLPTMTARDIGADVVIAVNVDEKLEDVTAKDMQKLTLLANRVTSIMLSIRDEQFARVADLVIHPEVSGISIISTDEADYPIAVEAGRAAANEALPQLRKLFGARTALKPTEPVKIVR